MLLTGAIVLLAVAMIIFLSIHWLRVTDRNREAARHKRMVSHLDWRDPRALR